MTVGPKRILQCVILTTNIELFYLRVIEVVILIGRTAVLRENCANFGQ